MKASTYCKQAIRYDSKDPLAYFLLGNAYRDLFNSHPDLEDLEAARKSYVQSLALNPDLEFSRSAKDYLEQIDTLLSNPKLRKMMN